MRLNEVFHHPSADWDFKNKTPFLHRVAGIGLRT